ncbi:hypothetical protein K9M79_01430 [Candidatus Woesearchaeota archaeon]|nr:hypothetical protein [Candidatus Woesearchaeota archaeon]
MEGTVYDKYRLVRESVKREFKKMEDRVLFKLTAKLATWHYPNKRSKQMTLTKEEAMLYEFYINNGYNPSTVYKWILACNSNEEVQRQLKNGEISLKKALAMPKYQRKLTQTDTEMLYQIKLAIQKYVVR